MEKAKPIVTGKKVHRPLLSDTVTDEDWKVAEIELNETPESRAEALKTLRQLLEEQMDFVSRTDDNFLLRFLRVRKFDVDRAFKLIGEFYKFRFKYPDSYRPPSAVEKALKANIFNYLPHRDHKGRAIFVVKMKNWNPDEVPYVDFIAAGNIISEYVLNTVTQINGYIGIYDTYGVNLKHFITFCYPKHIIMITTLMQERFPGRFKTGYFVNISPLLTKAYNIFKGAIKEKFRKRLKLLGNDITELHKYVDPSILPVEYGGVMPTSDCTEMAQKVIDNEPYYNYNRKFGYDAKV